MSKIRFASAMMQEWEETSWRMQTEANARADAIRKFAEWLECSGLNYDEEEAFWCRTHFDGKIFAEEVYTTNELLNLYEKEKEK